MNVYGKGFVGNKLYLNRIRTLVFCTDFIFHFGNSVLTNAETFDEDLTVGVGLEYFVVVLTGYAEREAFDTSVRRALHDLEVANHMVIDETNAGFIFDLYQLTVVYDCKVMISIVLDIVGRCLFLIEEVTTVGLLPL